MFFNTTPRQQIIGKIIDVDVTKISVNPNQPRKEFDEMELSRLAESIAVNGLINPISVRANGTSFELVAGERRLRACKLIGMESVPCIILNISERTSAILALLENIQRSELTFFDEAYGIMKLIDTFGLSQEDVANKLGRSQGAISNKLRLLRYSQEERDAIGKHRLTERHARAMLSITDPKQRLSVIEIVGARQMNVAATEKYVADYLAEKQSLEQFSKRACVLKNVKLFVNSLNKTISTMKLAGIDVDSKKTQSADYIEYNIRFPVR